MLTQIKFVIFTSIILSAFLAGCGQENPQTNEEKKNSMETVTLSQISVKEIGLLTVIASPKPFNEAIIVSARVLANQDKEAQVGSMLSGRVHNVSVNIGDYVKAGQILMDVEGLEIGTVKSDYLKAKAQLDLTKADFERHKILFEQKIGSKQSFYEAQAEFEKASAEFKAEDAKIHSIGLTDEEVINGNDTGKEHTSGTLPVRSPISGIVVERNVIIGQPVDESTNAFKIIDISSVWVDGQIYEKDINKVTKKTNSSFTSASYPGEIFKGKIIHIGQIIDPQTRTITVRAELSNLNGKLKPQMFGELQIPVGDKSSAILLPAECVIKINNSDYIFVQRNDSTFEKRGVMIGSTSNEQVEIIKGVKDGERVVIKGVFYLKSELLKDELGAEE